jgi:hypothetical protein
MTDSGPPAKPSVRARQRLPACIEGQMYGDQIVTAITTIATATMAASPSA